MFYNVYGDNMNFWITQIIGGLSYYIIALSYYKKKKEEILLFQILGYIGFTIHYYLLDGLTGTICNIIGLVALILIYIFDNYLGKEKKKILVILMVPVLIGISLLTYENIYSIFPIIASTISLVSFLTSDTNKIRLMGIFAALCWCVYAIIYKSYVALIFETITITTTIIAYKKNKK